MARLYYVVFVGKRPGIYFSWPECQASVNRFPGSCYKSYKSLEAAQKAFSEYGATTSGGEFDYGTASADMEYKPVRVKKGKHSALLWWLFGFVIGYMCKALMG